MRRRATLGLALAAALSLAGCGGAERRPEPVAGTFRVSSPLYGDERVLALVRDGGAVPLVRLVDAPRGAAAGAPIEGNADADTATIADWRFTSFARGLYRVGSAGADDRLSLSAGYGSSPAGIELAPSRKSAFQLWYVVPLADGHCRLVSALFSEAAFQVSGAGEDGREPRLAPISDADVGQRWRLVPLAGTTADGLPSLCAGATPGR